VGKANTPLMIGEFNSVNQSPESRRCRSSMRVHRMTYGRVPERQRVAGDLLGRLRRHVQHGNNNSSGCMASRLRAAPIRYRPARRGGQLRELGTDDSGGDRAAERLCAATRLAVAPPGGSGPERSVGLEAVERAGLCFQQQHGTAVMMFNLSQTATTAVTVDVTNAKAGSYNASTITYGKAQ